MHSRNRFTESDFSENLAQLKTIGIQSLFLTPYTFQKHIYSDSIFTTKETITDEDLISAIQLAKSSGFSVSLKPHVDCLDGEPRFRIEPVNIPTWFKHYRELMVKYAKISEQQQLSLLVIGTELDNIAENPLFISMIDTLRTVFSGKLTYASSYNHFLELRIWSKLDYIGVNCWLNLDNGSASDEQIFQSWNYWLNLLEQFSIYQKKPVLITETGFRSMDGTAQNPGDWSYTGQINLQLQACCYESLLSQVSSFPKINGVFWWQWELGNVGGPLNGDYTPHGKPAEEVIKKYWVNYE